MRNESGDGWFSDRTQEVMEGRKRKGYGKNILYYRKKRHRKGYDL